MKGIRGVVEELWSCSDHTVRERLGRICDRPAGVPGAADRPALNELDWLAEIMVGRHGAAQSALKADIQLEVLRRGPDRAT